MKTSENTVEILMDQVDYVTTSEREWCEIDPGVTADIAHDLAQARSRADAIDALIASLRTDVRLGPVGPFIAQEIENRLAETDKAAVAVIAALRAGARP